MVANNTALAEKAGGVCHGRRACYRRAGGPLSHVVTAALVGSMTTAAVALVPNLVASLLLHLCIRFAFFSHSHHSLNQNYCFLSSP